MAITALVALNWRRRYLTVGWLWFLAVLIPNSGLVQLGDQAMADRYAYLSFIGLFLMICWGLAEWAKRRHVAAVSYRQPAWSCCWRWRSSLIAK